MSREIHLLPGGIKNLIAIWFWCGVCVGVSIGIIVVIVALTVAGELR